MLVCRELRDRPDLRIVTDKNRNSEAALLVYAESVYLLHLDLLIDFTCVIIKSAYTFFTSNACLIYLIIVRSKYMLHYKNTRIIYYIIIERLYQFSFSTETD